MNDTDRYSRQSRLQQIGSDGQQKLAQSRVLIVGAGGLGCQVAAQLAGAGVGHLTIVDHDEIELSNIHRQVLFREQDIGLAKATVVARELTAINSTIAVSAMPVKLGPENIEELVRDCSAVVDAGDNFALSYLLSDACAKKIPLIAASVNKTYGYIGVFCGTAARPLRGFRAAFPQIPQQLQNCDMVGVTGPGVGIIASLQAQETLKVLLDDPLQLAGKLLYMDLWNYEQHTIDFSTSKEPPNRIALIDAAQLNAMDIVVDVRNLDEVEQQLQPFNTNLHIPLNQLGEEMHRLPRGGRIVCCCQSGQRALQAAQKLADADYVDLAVVL